MKIRFEYIAYRETGWQSKDSHTIINMEGETLRSCLLTAFEVMTEDIYAEADIISQEVNELGRRMSDKELLERLIHHQMWFDVDERWFDMISVTNLDTGIVLYKKPNYTGEIFELDVSSVYDNEESFEEEKELY